MPQDFFLLGLAPSGEFSAVASTIDFNRQKTLAHDDGSAWYFDPKARHLRLL